MQSYLLKTKAQLANQLYIKLKNTFKNVFYLKNYYISIYKNKLKSKMFWFQLAKKMKSKMFWFQLSKTN